MNEYETTAESAPAKTRNGLQGAGVAAICMLIIVLAGYIVLSKAPQGNAQRPAVIGPVRPTQSATNALVEATVMQGVTGVPVLVADKEKVDLGDIKLGKVVKVDFQLTNAGHQPLRINEAPYIEVVEGCCSPTPSISAMTLESGASATLSMQFMMHEGMGGKHLFRVHVKTNDPSQPDHTLDVASNWVP